MHVHFFSEVHVHVLTEKKFSVEIQDWRLRIELGDVLFSIEKSEKAVGGSVRWSVKRCKGQGGCSSYRGRRTWRVAEEEAEDDSGGTILLQPHTLCAFNCWC